MGTKPCVIFPRQIFVDGIHLLWLAEPRTTRRSDMKFIDFFYPSFPRPCWFINQSCGRYIFCCQSEAVDKLQYTKVYSVFHFPRQQHPEVISRPAQNNWQVSKYGDRSTETEVIEWWREWAQCGLVKHYALCTTWPSGTCKTMKLTESWKPEMWLQGVCRYIYNPNL